MTRNKLVAIAGLLVALSTTACERIPGQVLPTASSKPTADAVVICEDVTPPGTDHFAWKLVETDADHAWSYTDNYGSLIPPFTSTDGRHFVGRNLALPLDDRCVRSTE